MQSSAAFSKCRRYRYALWRQWAEGPRVLFVMLNPSTADETVNDPTIRRCISFAKAWGYGSLVAGNLFALRTPSPAVLKKNANPVGPRNDAWLRRLLAESNFVVAAWGNHGQYRNRSDQVRKWLPRFHVLGITKQGEPRHPLYVAGVKTPWHQLNSSQKNTHDCDPSARR